MADPELEQEVLRRRVLGYGLACPPIDPTTDLSRDLVLAVDADGRRDFARVEKIDALQQSLEIALTTALGSDVFNVEFGFDGLLAIVEETSSVMTRERVRIAVIQVLRRDARVRRILDVQLGEGALGAPAAGSRRLAVDVAFETVSGEQVFVNLGRVSQLG